MRPCHDKMPCLAAPRTVFLCRCTQPNPAVQPCRWGSLQASRRRRRRRLLRHSRRLRARPGRPPQRLHLRLTWHHRRRTCRRPICWCASRCPRFFARNVDTLERWTKREKCEAYVSKDDPRHIAACPLQGVPRHVAYRYRHGVICSRRGLVAHYSETTAVWTGRRSSFSGQTCFNQFVW